jgi:hypothetical protein
MKDLKINKNLLNNSRTFSKNLPFRIGTVKKNLIIKIKEFTKFKMAK